MNDFVLDASVAASWCFDDENHPIATAASAMLIHGARAVVPALFWFEVRNAVLMGHRRGRTSYPLMLKSIDRLSFSAIHLADFPASEPVFDLARRYRLTFYDAAYLELAQRERHPIATLDTALAAAAKAEGIPLIGA